MMANLGIIDADPSEPPSNEDVISLANRLLGEFSIPAKLDSIEHIGAALFVVLYESLFSERLPGIVREPYTREDEIHNCQTVIDVLSSEIVHDSLSHIRGVDIVSGNITAISNLLDIFSYLLEYVVNKIESDVQTDNEDKDSELGAFPVAKEMGKTNASPGKRENGSPHSKIRNKQKLREVYSTSNERQNMTSLNRNENRSTVISHEDFYNMTTKGITLNDVSHKYDAPPSPIQADLSESLLGQKTVDSTDLDGEVEKEKKVQPNGESQSPLLAWTEKEDIKDASPWSKGENREEDIRKSKPASEISNDDVLKDACESPGTLENRDKGFAASVPLPRHSDDLEKTEPFRATVGPIEYHIEDSQTASTKKTYSPKVQGPSVVRGLSSSYNDLKELVEKTAALTRVALRSSPIRRRVEKDLDITDFDERPRPVISSDGARHAKELNAENMRSSKMRDDHHFTAKASKKVAFMQCEEDKGKERFDEKDEHRRFQDDLKGDGGLSHLTSFGYPFKGRDEKSRFKYSAGEKKGTLHVGLSSEPVGSHTSKKSQNSSKGLALHLARNRQPELGAAHLRLRTEDRAVKKKQDFLRRMYDDNLDEFTDDVDVMISADKKAADETEEKLLKSYKNSAAKKKISKPSKTTSSITSYKKPKMSKANAKMSQPMSDHRRPSSSPTLNLKSDEDLLAVLLEEFPHLHLSDHTWHELWRKGLHQIEALTRVYQENKRKKSRAQTQMEEAAERHNLLSNIMNKQLEHAKRLREIKERKTQQVQIRNKAHEKRMQSARARRYYNEYQVRTRGKQLKRRTKEEMVFRELFKDALSIQKERINDIRQYTTDQRKRQESRRQDEIDSLENFYHDQFAMLAEKLAKEKKENFIRNAAQQQMLDQMKRELRKKMEHEIALYQEQVFRDDDDVHYRQLDADKLRHQLHKACYTSL